MPRQKLNFQEEFMKQAEKLDLYTKAIVKVHSQDHPELYQVRELFESLQDKLRRKDTCLDSEFEQLSQITNNYEPPEKACQTYKDLYLSLAKLNDSYRETE